MDKLPNVPSLKMIFPNYTTEKSDAIYISLRQRIWKDFDFFRPILNIFPKS